MQLSNLPYAGLLTLGEGWQNNHQSFPDSARFSLYSAQYDPGWWLIKALQSVGLAWNIKQASVLIPLSMLAKKQPLTESADSVSSSSGRIRHKAAVK
ncbi:MAG: hypothetical protein AAFZ17_09320 [Cyanobacteria bacterium J06650_10]